jgi:hypothetical protein
VTSKRPPTEAALKPLRVGDTPPLHMLVEGFSVFGMQVQYFIVPGMEYRGIQYQVVQTANPTGFKWTVDLGDGRIRTGQSFAMKAAIVDAERKIDRALKEKKAE